eukprot:gene1016-889_t
MQSQLARQRSHVAALRRAEQQKVWAERMRRHDPDCPATPSELLQLQARRWLIPTVSGGKS